MIYGYARVSTKTQACEGNSLRVQAECLREKGAQVIYSEAYTGTKVARPQLDLLMSNLKEGLELIAKTKEGYREGRSKLSREGLLSKQDACQELGVSTRTWHRMIKERRNADEF